MGGYLCLTTIATSDLLVEFDSVVKELLIMSVGRSGSFGQARLFSLRVFQSRIV